VPEATSVVGTTAPVPRRPAASPLGKAWRRMLEIVNHNRLTRVGFALTALFVIVAIVGPIILGPGTDQNSAALAAPSFAHPFGTDDLGRDVFARCIYGMRISLFVALGSVGLGLIVALPVGLVAGYYGGSWIDEVLMGISDVILALPLFVLGLFLLGITGTGSSDIGPVTISATLKVVLVIAVGAMPFFARVARAATLNERQEDYVSTLRVLGVSRRRIIFGEVLPNVLPPVIVQAFLWMALAIFAEAALSFLGLGIQPPEATLGNVLAEASPYMLTGAWWFSVLPGVLLTLIIVGLNLVGDGLSDALDPDLRV
jgi:ABC-type dipeptide/oligopeptide/nickel transport system permease subunit